MFSFSDFREGIGLAFSKEAPVSSDYKVTVNGVEIPVYTCRISACPFNTWWPGHQRQIEQSEIVSYVNLVSDEELSVLVEPKTKTAYERIMIKPYSKGIKAEIKDGKIAFTLKNNGAYVLELDDYHGLLYIFNNHPVLCKSPSEVTYYFGKGVHFPGKITLKSGESVYADKDALVYGCIFAEGAEDIRIYGNGIFDDSCEERVVAHCYVPSTNGNLKLYDCKRVRIEGLGFVNSAIWCVNLFHCFDVAVEGINIFGQWRYNTDGIDIVNSQRVTVRNSFVHSFDDSITVKGIDKYADTSNTDMLFEGCILWCDWGRACEIGLETMCREYSNIIFRDCDVIRGGSVACDIQNGDCAEVHHVTFENIRVELESFYTAAVYQSDDGEKYEEKSTEIAAAVGISNHRFREMKIYEGLTDRSFGIGMKPGERYYASVHDVLFKDIAVYADEGIVREYGDGCVRIELENLVEGSEYYNIVIDGLTLNGKMVEAEKAGAIIKGVTLK